MEWILPDGRPGYRQYRNMVMGMQVIGEGRRGKGEIILGKAGARPDFSEPLGPVFAYGALETDFGILSITVREPVNDQISVETVSQRAEDLPEVYEESRRWTYSYWNPGDLCPQCSGLVREVVMHPEHTPHETLVLAICPVNQRLWVLDAATMVNHLIPRTNFYNQLMLHKNIRDPKIALDGKRLFQELHHYSDQDLAYAFFTYNKLKTKVHIEGGIAAERKEGATWTEKLWQIFSKRP